MADTVTTQVLHDGPRIAVLRFTNVSDGTGEAAVTKVDVSTLEGKFAEVKIEKIKFATQGMAVRLLWDATADVKIIDLPSDEAKELDWCDIGGLINNAGDGKTGDINLTTIGHAAGDGYDVTLTLRKRGVA